MDVDRRLSLAAGLFAIAAGIATFVAGALHPNAADADSFQDAMAQMTASGRWDAAHWFMLAGFILLAVTLALLLSTARIAARPGMAALTRVAMLGSFFMAIEGGVHLVSEREHAQLIAGSPTPLIDVSQVMQTVGWPFFGLAVAALALAGARELALTGRWAGIVGAVGAAALALGGFLTEGPEVLQAGILYPVGLLMSLWLAWVGVRLSREALDGLRAAKRPTAPAAAEPGRA